PPAGGELNLEERRARAQRAARQVLEDRHLGEKRWKAPRAARLALQDRHLGERKLPALPEGAGPARGDRRRGAQREDGRGFRRAARETASRPDPAARRPPRGRAARPLADSRRAPNGRPTNPSMRSQTVASMLSPVRARRGDDRSPRG